MPEYKKVGYLTSSFKLFHLKDQNKKEFSYHYHDFHKILILLNGDITSRASDSVVSKVSL